MRKRVRGMQRQTRRCRSWLPWRSESLGTGKEHVLSLRTCWPFGHVNALLFQKNKCIKKKSAASGLPESHSTEEVEATPQEVMLGAASQERLRGTREGEEEAQVRPRSSRTHPSDHDLSQLIDLGHTVTSSYKGEGSPEREVFFISPSAEFYFLIIILKNFKPIETVEDIMDSNIHISPRFTYC